MRKKFLIRALALGLSFGALTALPNCYAETVSVSESATVDLNFDVSQGVEKTLTYDGRAVTFVAYENIFYVGKPVSDVQKLSVYIPAEYLRGETINGYSAKTAPIFLPNGVGVDAANDFDVGTAVDGRSTAGGVCNIERVSGNLVDRIGFDRREKMRSD